MRTVSADTEMSLGRAYHGSMYYKLYGDSKVEIFQFSTDLF